MGIHYADHMTPFIHKNLALTSPTSGGRSVGIVRSRTVELLGIRGQKTLFFAITAVRMSESPYKNVVT
jgi:hypothetical protein